ncbi:hypothetical protein BDQ12DRAFT_667180 [Crucibulum laeve]|uniref:Uncharacterized protein n=1 Tax=Crucibulum laeve TaxID=68775 RepID=A0A5C3LVT4_9AGAR|nr:hypothetical protein BDQ12DRAFT_667180 [Crucibulum laeve]
MQFITLTVAIVAALTLRVTATPAVPVNIVDRDTAVAEGVAVKLVTEAEMRHWIATTDAKLTFIGEPITDGLQGRAALNTMVTYCNKRTQNVCGGDCTVYNGGAACLNAPDTQCLSATNNVGFCDRSACGGSCNQLSTCGTHLDNNFCFTPGTRSINVGTA